MDMKPNQFWYCKILAMVVISSIHCSIYLLITMTFERFYSIIRPHKAVSFNRLKRAKITIAFTYTFSFSYNIPYLFIADNDGRICIQNRFASVNINIYGELYYWLSEVISFVLPFVSLLTMNSVIIHTLRQRSKLKMSEAEDQSPKKGQNSKTKNSDKQILTMLLFVTFGYLVLNIPVKSLIFYLNFYSGHTAYYYAGLHLFYQIGEKTFYTNHGTIFFLFMLCLVRNSEQT